MTLEMVNERIGNKNIKFDSVEFLKGFSEAFERHQELSRSSSEGKFKGGLADS